MSRSSSRRGRIDAWKRRFEKSQQHAYYTWQGRRYPRIKYGDEGLGWGELPCHDCGAMKGQFHAMNCEYEKCPVCGDLFGGYHPHVFEELDEKQTHDEARWEGIENKGKRIVLIALAIAIVTLVVWLAVIGAFDTPP